METIVIWKVLPDGFRTKLSLVGLVIQEIQSLGIEGLSGFRAWQEKTVLVHISYSKSRAFAVQVFKLSPACTSAV